MQNLTTPKAILIGLGLIAAAIASMPITGSLTLPAHAQNGITQVQICGMDYFDNEFRCAKLDGSRLRVTDKYTQSTQPTYR
jgi:hypothetical protein